MPGKTRRKRRDTFDFLSMWLTGYDFRVELGVNTNLRMSPVWVSLEDRILESRNWLEISGKCFDPEERAGEKFVITLSAEPSPKGFSETVRDVQQRDRDGVPQFRPHRGVQVPVFECPLGVAVLSRERRDGPWHAWMSVPERYVSDCLTVLSSKTARYMFIHEHIVGRQRWINGFSIQSGNPTE